MEKAVYYCNVGPADTLTVDTEFTSGPKESDIELRVRHGVLRQNFSIWLSVQDVKNLHNVLANALYDWYENGRVSEDGA